MPVALHMHARIPSVGVAYVSSARSTGELMKTCAI